MGVVLLLGRRAGHPPIVARGDQGVKREGLQMFEIKLALFDPLAEGLGRLLLGAGKGTGFQDLLQVLPGRAHRLDQVALPVA